MNKVERETYEGQLKRLNRSFWTNLFLASALLALYSMTTSWYYLIFVGITLLGGFVAIGGSKNILEKLGREDEI